MSSPRRISQLKGKAFKICNDEDKCSNSERRTVRGRPVHFLKDADGTSVYPVSENSRKNIFLKAL